MNDNFHKRLIKDLPVGYAYHRIICNEEGVPYDYEYVEINDYFEELTGLRSSGTIGKKQSEMQGLFNINGSAFLKSFSEVAINGGEKEIEYYSKYSRRYFRVKIFSTEKYYFGTIIYEITKERRAVELLKNSKMKYKLLTENISDVIWVYNLSQNKLTYISPSVFQLCGYTVKECLAHGMEEMLTTESIKMIAERSILDSKKFIQNSEDNIGYLVELQITCKNGEVIWIEMSSRYKYNSRNEIEIVGVNRNIDKRKKAESELIYLSYHDHLTGLYNSRYFEEELKRIDTKRNMPITLILADVNGLKLNNDAFGHMVGDEIIKNFANILKKVCREDDIIARIGGDEFIILLPSTDSLKAKKIIDRINYEIDNKREENILFSVSFGLQTKKDINESFKEVLIKAENLMYQQKLIGGNKCKKETFEFIKKDFFDNNVYERDHGEGVSKLCISIGIALGLSEETLNELEVAGRLHDIGKVGINKKVLEKREELSEANMIELKRHPEIGYRILKSINNFGNISEYVLAHHERMDGTGYPRGLKDEEIPLVSRIISIADSYDSMTRPNNYKHSLSVRTAIQELKAGTGKQFDANIVKVFVEKVLEMPWDK